MRTVTHTQTIRTFDELELHEQQKVLEDQYYINVDYDWWDSTYDDAAQIGLKITAFDLGRANYVKGEFIHSPIDVAERILKEHGEQCETYKTTANYLHEFDILFSQLEADMLSWPGDARDWDAITYYETDPEDLEDLNNEFLKSLCEDYRIILRDEYDYLTTQEAIRETIESNEYEFDEKLKIYSGM